MCKNKKTLILTHVWIISMAAPWTSFAMMS